MGLVPSLDDYNEETHMEKIKSLWTRIRLSASRKLAAIKAFLRGTSPKAVVKAVAVRIKNTAVALFRWFRQLDFSEKVIVVLATFSLASHLGVFGLLATLALVGGVFLQVGLVVASFIVLGMLVQTWRNFRASQEDAPAAPANVSTPATRQELRAQEERARKQVRSIQEVAAAGGF